MNKASKLLKSNRDKHYEWLMAADMFLATSVILCDEMLKSFRSPIPEFNHTQQIDRKCSFTSRNPDYEMIVPAVFNLKHGVEVYIKSLIMKLDSNAEYPPTHDLMKLFDILLEKLPDLDLSELKTILEKYYYGMYAFTKDKSNPDINNEAERYPEHRYTPCYEVADLYKIVERTLIEEIKGDAWKAQSILRSIYTERDKNYPTFPRRT